LRIVLVIFYNYGFETSLFSNAIDLDVVEDPAKRKVCLVFSLYLILLLQVVLAYMEKMTEGRNTCIALTM
jgi:hypothetical protein